VHVGLAQATKGLRAFQKKLPGKGRPSRERKGTPSGRNPREAGSASEIIEKHNEGLYRSEEKRTSLSDLRSSPLPVRKLARPEARGAGGVSRR